MANQYNKAEMDTEVIESDKTGEEHLGGFGEIELTGEIIAERYRFLDRIGEGGMGVIYRAEHTLMRKTLAIKVLHPELTTVEEVVQRFEREAQAAANIDHPNVCAATDFGRAPSGEFYLVMEYLDGELLSELLEKGPLPLKTALYIAEQICSALSRAHEMGIIHRDLKPENVMLVEREGDPHFVKVLDFGIARVPVPQDCEGSQTLTRAGFVMGTPAYLSPEQAAGGEIDHRADLYSLGVMLFEMIAGQRPFESPSMVELIGMHVTKIPPSLNTMKNVARLPRNLDRLVSRLLAKEARERPQSAAAVRDELRKIAEDFEVSLSSDSVSIIAREAAFRAAESFNTVRARVTPVLLDVKMAAPDALPLLRRMPRGIWAAIVANLVLGSLIVCGFWSVLVGDDSEVEEPSHWGGMDENPRVEEPVKSAPPPRKILSALEKIRLRPDVAAALAKEKTQGLSTTARELAAIYKHDKNPDLAYLLARTESKIGEDYSALQHAEDALLGNPSYAGDKGMRAYIFKELAGRNSGFASNIVKAYYLPQYASELQERACSFPRKSGRIRIQTVLLAKSGSLEKLEPYCKFIIELERGRNCTDRRKVIQGMAELGDVRALPALRFFEQAGHRRRSVYRRGRRRANNCLIEDLQKAIKALESAESAP